MSKISVYLTEELDRDMKLYVKHKGFKITEFVSLALRQYLDNNIEELEFARKQEREREEFNRLRWRQQERE